MTVITLSNNDKMITINLSNKIHINKNDKTVYEIDLPVVKCNRLSDAEYIQKETNAFINNICKNLLK